MRERERTHIKLNTVLQLFTHIQLMGDKPLWYIFSSICQHSTLNNDNLIIQINLLSVIILKADFRTSWKGILCSLSSCAWGFPPVAEVVTSDLTACCFWSQRNSSAISRRRLGSISKLFCWRSWNVHNMERVTWYSVYYHMITLHTNQLTLTPFS